MCHTHGPSDQIIGGLMGIINVQNGGLIGDTFR